MAVKVHRSTDVDSQGVHLHHSDHQSSFSNHITIFLNYELSPASGASTARIEGLRARTQFVIELINYIIQFVNPKKSKRSSTENGLPTIMRASVVRQTNNQRISIKRQTSEVDERSELQRSTTLNAAERKSFQFHVYLGQQRLAWLAEWSDQPHSSNLSTLRCRTAENQQES